MHLVLAIVAIIASLLLVVGIHEAGHAVVARLCSVQIKRISIGFGMPLLRWQGRGGCEWVWALWPLGGYVQLLNTRIAPVAAADYGRCFDKKPVWVRIVILLSGAGANILMAWFALALIMMIGHKQTPPVIASVTVQSIAARAALTPGDQFIRIANIKTESWQTVGMQLIKHLGQHQVPVVMTSSTGVTRQTVFDLSGWHYTHKDTSLLASIGVSPDLARRGEQHVAGVSLIQALCQSWLQMISLLSFFLVMLKQLLTGVIPFMLLLGPFGFFTTMVDSFFQGVVVFLYFIANLSLSVALINLFPIPSLDGGSIIYALVEKIRGKPVSVAFEILLHRLIFIAFCLIFIQLLMNDVHRLMAT